MQMNARIYTDEELSELRTVPKRVLNPGARWVEKPSLRPVHRQRTFRVSGHTDENLKFSIYQRQNMMDDCDFSCGISYLTSGARPLTLARYNGSSHKHEDIYYKPHIHRTFERTMAAGKRPEAEAEETSRFETLEGALACLIEDYRLSGIRAKHDEQRLL